MMNQFWVGALRTADGKLSKVLIGATPQHQITADEALNLAAWLVAVADPIGGKFQRLLEEVLST